MAENHLPQGDDLPQQVNTGFGSLFLRRGKTVTFASVTMLVIAIIITGAVLFFTVKEKEKEVHSQLITIALHTSSVILAEMIRRFFLLCEEFQHKDTRYGGKWKKIFEATFSTDYFKRSLAAAILIITICIVCGYLLNVRYEILPRPDFVIFFFLNSLVVDQLSHICGLRELAPAETSDLIQKGNKSVAYGLAWGYYFNYLKLMLPVLKEQIAKSEQFRDQISVTLFILVPRTCCIYGKIASFDSRVKFVVDLPEMTRNSGGIEDRSYKNAVHMVEKLQPDGTVEKYFFLVEYATALETLYKMSRNGDDSLTNDERDHQVVLFYQKLTELLENCKVCRGLYKLVPISGEDSNEISKVLMECKDQNRDSSQQNNANSV
ncbi:unnamed protein product [Pocillopora meandrina]|uniref:Stimulator of interferon genes protein n=1 Tax=Pocillopora meandrina TaxID=46732 RepID=A0AAU9XMZ1_9CNID|nr:unnamed protein product [Pocillopora meandrina]